jgi:hypothetical protein
MKTNWKVAGVAALVLVCHAHIAPADIVWPAADTDWTALTIGTDNYFDDLGDQNPSSVDLIGTTDSFSAGYWALVENGHISGGTTNDAFMFRMRVGGESGNYVWQTHLDTDGNASNVEWIFQLVQSGNPGDQGVELIQTAVGGTTLADIDTGSNTASWLGELNLYSRWSAVPGGGTDFYVDFAIPWSTLTNITGVTEVNDIRAVLSTSTTHSGINKDAPLNSDLSLLVSNALSESIPEPAVVTLLLGAGGGMLFYRRIFKKQPDDDEPPA